MKREKLSPGIRNRANKKIRECGIANFSEVLSSPLDLEVAEILVQLPLLIEKFEHSKIARRRSAMPRKPRRDFTSLVSSSSPASRGSVLGRPAPETECPPQKEEVQHPSPTTPLEFSPAQPRKIRFTLNGKKDLLKTVDNLSQSNDTFKELRRCNEAEKRNVESERLTSAPPEKSQPTKSSPITETQDRDPDHSATGTSHPPSLTKQTAQTSENSESPPLQPGTLDISLSRLLSAQARQRRMAQMRMKNCRPQHSISFGKVSRPVT